MKPENLIDDIKELIIPTIIHHCAELIDLELKGRVGNQVLRIFVDTDSGITLQQCVTISRDISDILDQKNIFSGKYRLEISSPGIDRPLKNYKDFKRNLSRLVQVSYLDANGEQKSISGSIVNVDEHDIILKVDDSEYKISIGTIQSGKVLAAWETRKKHGLGDLKK